MLSVDANKKFPSPFFRDQPLLRTGTHGEGSCLIHAILRGTSRKYNKLDHRGQLRFVRDLRKEIAKQVSPEVWKALGGGMTAKVDFDTELYASVKLFYKAVQRGSFPDPAIRAFIRDNCQELRREVEAIPKKMLRNNVITPVLPAANNIDDAKNRLAQRARDTMGDNLMTEAVPLIADYTERKAFRNFVVDLSRCDRFLGHYELGLLSEYFNMDIFFMNGETRLPYPVGCSNIKGRHSVIILWVDEVHYEIIGRMQRIGGGKVSIERSFSPDDPMIIQFRRFLCDRASFAQNYPDLVQYLPADARD